MNMLTIKELVNDNAEKIPFEWIAGQNPDQKVIATDGAFGAELVGHLNLVHPTRIQVFGHEELNYYQRFDDASRKRNLMELINGGVPALIMADDIDPPQELIPFCNKHNIPLLKTSHTAAQTIDLLRIYMGKRLAPTTIMHGVFMDVLGLGVLITGESGLGKSELALELISRGHGLVADDAVEIMRTAPNMIEGQCPPLLQNLLEVRGLGLLDIRTIFGETSVRRKKKLKLIVQLLRTTPDNFERLPTQEQTQEILGLPVKTVMIQVAAGRNLAVLVEAAVRNSILKLRGIDTLNDFIKRQNLAIQNSSKQDNV